MGGSSSQVTGYRYFANFLLFIGNPIEQLIAINFDKRGWMTGRRVSMGDNGQIINIEAPSLYGENEGGVAGTLALKLGTNSQTSDSVYKKYMESLGLQASAYPYQSYISFSGGYLLQSLASQTEEQLQELADQYNNGIIPGRGFYVGNSGYMKEMLLWPKRIHVRNDGRGQWYDEKAEIDLSKTLTIGNEFIVFPLSLSGETYWADQNGEHTVNFGSGKFPFFETQQSYQSGVSENGPALPEQPSAVAAITTLSAHGLPFNGGTILPPATWTSYPPETDGFWSGAIVRRFTFKTDFSWSGGRLEFKGVFSENRASVIISKKNIDGSYTAVKTIGNFSLGGGYIFTDGYQDLEKGDYQLSVNVGSRYETQGAARPFIQFLVKAKTMDAIFGDINPVHKIREVLMDDTAMNKPESSVNNENFIKAADRIFDEGLGISWSITEKSCMDAINELCYHIEAGIRVNRQTGLYEMVLFRDDWFEENEIHVIAENKIKKGSMQYEITNADEVINQVNVNYYDRANIKNSSFSIPESGLIQTIGRVNAETVDFPYFMNMRNAEIVANWKLKILSTGVLKGSFTTGWREARKWNRYDLIKLPWSKRWAEPILVRIMNIKLGGPTSNEVSIEWVEVVPMSGMMNTTIVADEPVNTQPEAPKPCNAKVFELPYFEAVQAFGEREVGIELTDNPEAGYLCAIAEKPQNNSLNAALYADSGSGFERVATVNYCETAYLDQAIDRMSSVFVVKDAGNIASIRTGSQIFTNNEIMVYQSYDAETKVLTVKRGALDSIPQNHLANSILYFADDFVAVDQTLYVDSEIIDAKVLTTTPSGVLDPNDAVTYAVEFNARAIRPYPPANVKINGEYFPANITGNLDLSWVHRNRVQQTGGEVIGWHDGGVAPEDGVTYKLSVKNDLDQVVIDSAIGAVNSYSLNLEDVAGSNLDIELYSVRGGADSLQHFKHSVDFVGATYLYKNLFKSTANITVRTTGTYSLSANSTIGGLTFSSSDTGIAYFIQLTDAPSVNSFDLTFDFTKKVSTDNLDQFGLFIGKSTWSSSSMQGVLLSFSGNTLYVDKDGSSIQSAAIAISTNVKYSMRLVSSGTNIKLYINGVLKLNLNVTVPVGSIGFRYYPYGGTLTGLIENMKINPAA